MTQRPTGAAYSVTVRLEYANAPGALGRITSAIGEGGGDIEAVDVVHSTRQKMRRDITINTRDTHHSQELIAALRNLPGVRLVNYSDPTFLLHLGGKIHVQSKTPLRTRNDLSLAYTPGVGRVSRAIYERPADVWSLTSKGRTVAVVSDGSAVLGLGNLGPEAALPVLEGKVMLFRELAGVDAWPIALATQEPEEIIETVKRIAPGFGGVNLEDISAPRCFDVEERLAKELDIPVFHDDQHGTAVVVLAGLYNAERLTGKPLGDMRIVMVGLGAGGVGTARLLTAAGARRIIGFDKGGAIHRGQDHAANSGHRWVAANTNPDGYVGDLAGALEGADVFIGLSGPGALSPGAAAKMADDAIVFALANPDPELFPDSAPSNVRVMATGRSDFPNQINNALCFPGLFKGLLDVQARGVNREMEMEAAKAIASSVPARQLNEEYLVPNLFNRSVAPAVAKAVAEAARKAGLARRASRRASGASLAVHR